MFRFLCFVRYAQDLMFTLDNPLLLKYGRQTLLSDRFYHSPCRIILPIKILMVLREHVIIDDAVERGY